MLDITQPTRRMDHLQAVHALPARRRKIRRWPLALLALILFYFLAPLRTNIPIWQWPRLLFALLRAFLFGIDSQTITRDMVAPFQTSQGAQVLAPNWEAINPLLKRMFGE